MEYSPQTASLIERMCRNVEREDFELDKEKAQELILQTYNLFKLERPKKIVWCVDIFDEKFAGRAWSAWSAGRAGRVGSAGRAGSAGSAWSAWSAGRAWSAGSAGRAWSAGSAGRAWSAGRVGSAGRAGRAGSAWSAWSAGRAWSAWSAGRAGSARSALDYDFDWYVFEFEYCQNPDSDKLPNENDKIYLEYCELLMQAKEAGLGYRVEWKDTLYLVPTPFVKIDSKNRFHSLISPAIRWKGGKEFYYIAGVNLDRKKWEKIRDKSLLREDILNESNAEVRRIMMEQIGNERFVELCQPEIISVDEYGELMKIDLQQDEPWVGVKVKDASIDKTYILRVPPDTKTAHAAVAWSFSFTDVNKYIPVEQA